MAKGNAALATTKVIPAEKLAKGAVIVAWIGAVMFIVKSTAGTFVFFVSGWNNAANIFTGDDIALYGLLYAMGFQLICSICQWTFKAKHWIFPYIMALVFSVVPSFFAYWWLLGEKLVLSLGGGIWVTLTVGAFLLVEETLTDMLPEWILVE